MKEFAPTPSLLPSLPSTEPELPAFPIPPSAMQNPEVSGETRPDFAVSKHIALMSSFNEEKLDTF